MQRWDLFLRKQHKQPSKRYPIETRISNTETRKDASIMEALVNRDKTITAEVVPTPSNAYINHKRAERTVYRRFILI